MKKLAIIGASYLQRPLVLKAKEMGLETHVFAWNEGNVVSDISDFFYPISITEKEIILKHCQNAAIDGIISIASDLAMPAVNYIANRLNLIGNSLRATNISTNKYKMRRVLKRADLPSPAFQHYIAPDFNGNAPVRFPVIVKPTDRSGSRGVSKIDNADEVNDAIQYSLNNSISKGAIVEEFIEGQEYSVEMLSFHDDHQKIAITEKETSGPPYFVETAHHQPALLEKSLEEKIYNIVEQSLNALQIKNGASHSEVLITKDNDIYIVEVAGRMGGDFIGSDLVYLSTGYDYLQETIKVALNIKPEAFINKCENTFSGVYFLTPENRWVSSVIDSPDKNIYKYERFGPASGKIKNSSERSGYFIYRANKKYIREN